jgi:hypothetical protein
MRTGSGSRYRAGSGFRDDDQKFYVLQLEKYYIPSTFLKSTCVTKEASSAQKRTYKTSKLENNTFLQFFSSSFFWVIDSFYPPGSGSTKISVAPCGSGFTTVLSGFLGEVLSW